MKMSNPLKLLKLGRQPFLKSVAECHRQMLTGFCDTDIDATVYCKSFKVKSFAVFVNQSVNTKFFSVN